MRAAFGSLVVFPVALVVACGASDRGRSDPGPCLADDAEPNDTAPQKKHLGTLTDDDELIGPDAGAPAGSIKKGFTAHGASDVDWYTVDVRDTGLGGNPRLSVVISAAWEATVWFTCANGRTESVVCGLGEAVTDDPELAGRGCKTGESANSSVNVNLGIECAGTSSDDGTITIRAKKKVPSATCERYLLSVFAE